MESLRSARHRPLLLALCLAAAPACVPEDEGRKGPLRTQEGEATYYHDALEGRTTASGQPMDQSAMVAAHRSLPFGSRVRVRNLENGREVVVSIVDRGPYAPGRRAEAVIDLSRAAARRLGFLEDGRAPVRLEVLTLGEPDGDRP